MPQSDGKNRLKRIELEYKGESYTFTLNPEEYSLDEPSRSTVTQTKGGAWVDDFGPGLKVITISGTTGFNKGQGESKFKKLRDLIRKYMSDRTPGRTVENEMIFHNYTDGESWVVHVDPTGFRTLRSKNQPLLYRYEIRFIVLRSAGEPATKATSATVGAAVMSAFGSPIPLAREYTGQERYEVVTPFLAQEMSVTQSMPSVKLTNFVNSLDVKSDGKVQSFQQFQTSSILPPGSDPRLEEVEVVFQPVVSPLSLATIEQIKQGNLKVTFNDPQEGTILDYVSKLEKIYIPNDIWTALKIVVLEVFSILKKIEEDIETLPSLMSKKDLQRLIYNVRWLSEELFKLNNVDKELANKLRWVERSLKYIENSSIYEKTFEKAMQNLEQSRG